MLLAYVAFDLADPILPGAFSLGVGESEIEQAVHVRCRQADRLATPATPAPLERRLQLRDDALTRRHSTVRAEPSRNASPPRPAARSALLTAASALDDH